MEKPARIQEQITPEIFERLRKEFKKNPDLTFQEFYGKIQKNKLECIRLVIESYYQVTLHDNAVRSSQPVSFAREMAIKIASSITDYGQKEIVNSFGKNERSLVPYANNKMNKKIANDGEIEREYYYLLRKCIEEITL